MNQVQLTNKPRCKFYTLHLLTIVICNIAISIVTNTAKATQIPQNAYPNTGIVEEMRGKEASSQGWVAKLLHWYDSHMNYFAVTTLMTIESSFIPFPSEIVIPPAVYVAANPQSSGNMKIWLIVLAGTIGSLIGAALNYYLSLLLGRPIIYSFANSHTAKRLGLSKEKLDQAEFYFNRHGIISTLIGRFIPVIRQLISIPAGLAKMNIGTFCLFTALGAFAWNCILALLGWIAYKAANPAIIEQYSHQIGVIIIAVLSVVFITLIIRHIIKKNTKSND